MKIPFEDIQDQCFIAATRSRSKEASEKVPDIFPLQGEHRKNLNMCTNLKKIEF